MPRGGWRAQPRLAGRRSRRAPHHVLLQGETQRAQVRARASHARAGGGGGPRRGGDDGDAGEHVGEGARGESRRRRVRAPSGRDPGAARGRAEKPERLQGLVRARAGGDARDAGVRVPDVLRPAHEVRLGDVARLARAFERGGSVARPPPPPSSCAPAQQMGGTSGAAGAIAQVRVTSGLAARAVRGDPGGGAQPGRRGGQDPEARRVRGGARHALGRRPERSRRGTRELALGRRARPRAAGVGHAPALAPAASADRPGVALPAAADPAAAVARAAGGDACATARSWRCSASSSSRAPEASTRRCTKAC